MVGIAFQRTNTIRSIVTRTDEPVCCSADSTVCCADCGNIVHNEKNPLLFEQDERNEEEKNVCKQSDYKIVSRTLFNPSDYMQ